jgi:RNA polymerase sigma factor (sigma-70 family)
MDDGDLQAKLEAVHKESFSWSLTCCGGRWSDAEDVLQTVYYLILTQSARFGGQSEFKTWLFSVIRNQAAKDARKQMIRRLFLIRHEREREPQTGSPQPDASLESAEIQGAFELALNQLPGRQREVLHLVFYEGLTIQAASEVMGVSLGAARRHYERAKSRLRQEFQVQMENDEHDQQ